MELTGVPPGQFNWADLATTDAQAAKQFYTAVFGWEYFDVPMGEGQNYSICLVNGKQACALHGHTAGQPPHWGVYVAVEDANAVAARAKQLGGSVLMEPFDVFDQLRMAVIQDPSGAVFSISQPINHKGMQVTGEKGAIVWNELNTRDTEKAKDFYSALFGWSHITHPGSMPYTEFSQGETKVAGMMSIQPEWGPDVPSNWLVYFGADDVDAAANTVSELGGRALAGPMQIPDMGRFAVLIDPQGAVFAIYK